MSAKYILRLDDACPTMDKIKWQRIEDLCYKHDIKPIVAVIPNNSDSEMIIDPIDNEFWEKVRNWQAKGWSIALHGYDHVYISDASGLVPFNNTSEFAGLRYEEQKKKITLGLEIFSKNKVEINVWVAPSHTFDENTLKALRGTSIDTVSDGIALSPFTSLGFKWIPQQLWYFREMLFGTWTACFHPNTMDEADFEKLELFIKESSQSFIDIETLEYSKLSMLDRTFSTIYWVLRRIKSAIKI